jgi:hypothetical protein
MRHVVAGQSESRIHSRYGDAVGIGQAFALTVARERVRVGSQDNISSGSEAAAESAGLHGLRSLCIHGDLNGSIGEHDCGAGMKHYTPS